MKFAIMGGDERSLRLCALLRRDGHAVLPFAMGSREADADTDEIAAADAAVLPLPCVKDGVLNAAFAETAVTIDAALDLLSPGTPVLAGKAEPVAAACRERQLPLADYFTREDFTVTNAALTAEGALAVMLRSPRAILGSRVLVCGYGRIGRLLALRLGALGAGVTIAARSAAQRATARADGFASRDFAEAPGEYDFIVNTVPAQVWPPETDFGDARLIELASPPYGFPPKALARAEIASGLPGKTAPDSAAEALRDAVYAILEESQWTKLE